MACNVFGEPLVDCSQEPLTGFFRNGKCDTCGEDDGMHTVCAEMSVEFLLYSKMVGNDLSTPNPALGFAGLAPGDFWCLCLDRWVQAFHSGVAPRVKLEATHISVLEYIDIEILKNYGV